MERKSFLELLRRLEIDEHMIVLDDGVRDGYCVRKNGLRWEVLIRERGVESDVMGFPSEDDALGYLAQMLLRMYSK